MYLIHGSIFFPSLCLPATHLTSSMVTLQKNRPIPAFLQNAVIDKIVPVLKTGTLQSVAIGGL